MLVLEGRAFYRGGLESLAIGIEAGRIAQIAKVLEGDERTDYGERLILPGGVDLHVHFRDPGYPIKEDFSTGTAAAAVGGVTTVLDMPNTAPPVTSVSAYNAKLAAVRGKAHVDFGLYAAFRTQRDPTTFRGVAPAGKIYMAPTTGELAVDEPTAQGIVKAVAETRTFTSVHAESPAKFGGEEGRTLPAHDHMRPPEAEAAAIKALAHAALQESQPPRIHIAHVSSRAALEALAGASFTAEVTPHHLFLEATMNLQARGKVNPPLRRREEREALWRALADGRIDALASDHAPHTIEEKDQPFEQAPAGIPGVETMLPLVLRAVRAGDLTLERFVDVAAKRPAELLGLNAGVIEVGRLANLIVVDPRAIVTVRTKALHSRCGWTPFEGMEAVFPEATYVRGELAARDGSIVGERLGRPIPAAVKPEAL